MPIRETPLINNEIYHLFNRGVDSCPTFLTSVDYRRFLKTINFYRYFPLPVRLSQFLDYSIKEKENILNDLASSMKDQVSILSFCLMPNHYHILARQIKDNGISNFLRLVQNSYTKYFNIKKERIGPLFQGPFKVVRVETDEQLIHLSRYIHLNPYSSYVVKSIEDLVKYPWSSFTNYLGKNSHQFVNKRFVLGMFKSKREYQNFVFNQADYQRQFEIIKHLAWEH
ncbi:transposase [Patescibacteria group bacterium]